MESHQVRKVVIELTTEEASHIKDFIDMTLSAEKSQHLDTTTSQAEVMSDLLDHLS